jgi:GTP 3',8-cyclase
MHEESPLLEAAPEEAPWPADGPLVDAFARSKRKLRLSLTDRCNFRCGYCMPANPVWKPRDALLSFAELERLASVFVRRLGIEAIRLTGGEPLMRRDCIELISRLNALRARGLERISLTTNGTLLARYAEPLRAAGLDDVNVSLDSIEPARFRRLTGGGELTPVLEGILAARDAGLDVKANAVVIRGDNEDDVVALAEWSLRERVALRYIEFMPLDGRGQWRAERVVGEEEILARLRTRFEVEPLPRTREPAAYYRLAHEHRIGIIPTVSNPFCSSCDRVRVTSVGELYPCLFSPQGIDLRATLRSASDDLLEQRIRGALWGKGRGFLESAGYVSRPISMHGLGG